MDGAAPTGGKFYRMFVGDDGKGHFAVSVIFEGFPNREEAQAYAGMLAKRRIFDDSNVTRQ